MPMLKVGATSRSEVFCASWAMISGQSQSVPSRPVGPCCSLEPMGITTVFERFSWSSISCQVDRCSSMRMAFLRCPDRLAPHGRRGEFDLHLVGLHAGQPPGAVALGEAQHA